MEDGEEMYVVENSAENDINGQPEFYCVPYQQNGLRGYMPPPPQYGKSGDMMPQKIHYMPPGMH